MPIRKGGTKARKPTRLKFVEGTENASRRNAAEPAVEGERADALIALAPDRLDAEELEVWTDYARQLGPLRVAGKEDLTALEALVTCRVQWLRLNAQLRKDAAKGDKKLTYETITSSGSKIQRSKAALTTLNEVDRRLKDWLARFGLTPADRARVNSDEAPGERNKDEEFRVAET